MWKLGVSSQVSKYPYLLSNLSRLSLAFILHHCYRLYVCKLHVNYKLYPDFVMFATKQVRALDEERKR